MNNLPEDPWSFKLDRDPESADFTLLTISVDANDKGRLRDYGRSIIEGTITDPTIDIQALGELLSQAPTLAATVAAQREVIGALVAATENLVKALDDGRFIAPYGPTLIPVREALKTARAALERAKGVTT